MSGRDAGRSGGGLGGRAGGAFAVADQGLASAGNILLLILVARQSSEAGFADFSLAYVVFTVILGVTAAFVGQPLVLVRDLPRGDLSSPDRSSGLAAACGQALGFTVLSSLAVGSSLVVASLLLGSSTWRSLGALGLVLVVMLTQEVARYCFAALRLPHLAFASDAVKVLCLVIALIAFADDDASRMVLVWGISTIPALVVSLSLLARHVARPRGIRGAMLGRGYLGRRFALEFLVGNGASQITVLGVGAFGTPLAVGALRGASTLFGPLNVLFTASTSFGPPYLSRLSTPRQQIAAAGRIGGALAAVAAVWATVIVALPSHAGEQVLGETWEAAHGLAPATGVQYMAMAMGSAAVLALRLVQPRATLPIQVIFSGVNVVAVVTGYLLLGTMGAAWGLAAGSALKAGALWWRAWQHRGSTESGSDG